MKAEMKSRQRLSTLWLRLAENIDNDFMEIFIITSQAAGLEPSMGRPFGVGKSTLAIWMAYRAHAYAEGLLEFDGGMPVDLASEEERLRLMKTVVEDRIVWTLKDLIDKIRGWRSEDPIPALIWDDAQKDCPAWTHIPPLKRSMIEYITMSRQRVANIILTAPSIGDVAKPLRRNITWEIIVPSRGVYEVQFIAKRRNFYEPTEDVSRLWYEVTGKFDRLPESIDELYKKRRDAQLNVFASRTSVVADAELIEKDGRILARCPFCNYTWPLRSTRPVIQCPACNRQMGNPNAKHRYIDLIDISVSDVTNHDR
jgi:hypothetical protein